MPYPVNEWEIEPIMVKTAHQFSFELWRRFSSRINWFFFRRTDLFWFFPESIEDFREKRLFPNEWFGNPEKPENTRLPAYEVFFSKLRNKIFFAEHYSDFQYLIDGINYIQSSFFETNTESNASNCTRKPSKLHRSVGTRKHVYLHVLLFQR